MGLCWFSGCDLSITDMTTTCSVLRNWTGDLLLALRNRNLLKLYYPVMYKIKLSGVAPRKRETTNVGSARYSGAFFARSNDGSQAMVGVGKALSHDHLRTEVLFWREISHGLIHTHVHRRRLVSVALLWCRLRM